MDRLNKEQRRKNMQAVKSSGSKIEMMLSRALFAKGYRYRKNDESVFGKPDISFKKYKVAVFVDGEFWHGKDWKKRKYDLKSNQEFWIRKIESNIRRDRIVRKRLEQGGWVVHRFWGKEIEEKLQFCIKKIETSIDASKEKNINRTDC
jgi:DNA mismatch endonuclease Vsr